MARYFSTVEPLIILFQALQGVYQHGRLLVPIGGDHPAGGLVLADLHQAATDDIDGFFHQLDAFGRHGPHHLMGKNLPDGHVVLIFNRQGRRPVFVADIGPEVFQ